MKQPWPTKKAMEQVYEQHLWGGNQTDFYSGEGSHHAGLVLPYLKVLTSFLSSFTPYLSLTDLGCGDFNIGKQLLPYTEKYVAVDIVPALIERNKAVFEKLPVTFQCLDIAKDQLPTADVALLRQVLQHLSNAEIKQILPKLAPFKYIIVTEHLPEGEFTPNLDIISGQGIRLKKQSGVNLVEAPFHLNAKEETQLLTLPLEKGKGIIVTTAYRMF